MHDEEKNSQSRRSILLVPLLIFSLGIALGALRVQMSAEKVAYLCKSACTFTATIVSSPESKDEYQTFVIRPEDRDESTHDILVRVPLYPRYDVGSTISITGIVREPTKILPHNGGQAFDYASYLATKSIGSVVYYPRIEILDGDAHDVPSLLIRWKDDLVSRINMYVGQPASSLASGMLFGASSLTKELQQTFRVAGLSHIIVLSGFNIAIVISSILFVFAFLPLVLRVILASFSVILFVIMVGAEPSVVRATLMVFVSLVALLLGRTYVSRQALMLSLFAIVMYSPESLLHDVSLHLSFLATAGIVYMTDIFDELFTKVHSQLIRSTLATTLAAYIATTPYIMHTFGMFSLYSLISNVLVVPLVPLAMLLSFTVVVLSYIGETLAYIVGYLNTLLIDIMIFVAKGIAWLPYSSLTISISYLGMISMYIVIIIIVAFLTRKKIDETVVTKEGVVISGIMKY